jgi:hypothetical protein
MDRATSVAKSNTFGLQPQKVFAFCSGEREINELCIKSTQRQGFDQLVGRNETVVLSEPPKGQEFHYEWI